MSWYKQSQKVTNFKERNHINARIRIFQDMIANLHAVENFSIQNPPEAQKIVQSLIDSKELSSFPDIKKILISATQVARDNYKVFKQRCMQAKDALYAKLTEMENDREEFSRKTAPKDLKGFFAGQELEDKG